MNRHLNLKDREPVWLALSEFYLNTELQQYDVEYIAKIFSESPFSLKEIKGINKYEVFPILYPNLMNPAGVWDGFDKEWLLEKLKGKLNSPGFFGKLRISIIYFTQKWMFADYWQKLENILGEP